MWMCIIRCMANRQVVTVSSMSFSPMSISAMSLSPMSIFPMCLSVTSISAISLSMLYARMRLSAMSKLVLALQRRRGFLCQGLYRVLVLFVSFVLIYLSQALIIIPVARFLDCSQFILFIVLWNIMYAVFLQLLAYKEPSCDDAVEAQ
jgi:hypothetical protein